MLRDVLSRLGLAHRLEHLHEVGSGALEGLSMGERQRLALARVLLLRPATVVLDEATSALDAAAEAHVLTLLRNELPQARILCVSHNQPIALVPFAIWQIGVDPEAERKSA